MIFNIGPGGLWYICFGDEGVDHPAFMFQCHIELSQAQPPPEIHQYKLRESLEFILFEI